MRRAVLVVAAAFAVLTPVASAEQRRTELVSVGANDYDTTFDGASKDGTRAVFTTGTALAPGDTDGLCDRGTDYETGQPLPPGPCQDVYLRDLKTGVTKLVSTGPTGGSGHFDASFPFIPGGGGVSDDGKRVLFATYEQLVSQDTDNSLDFYSRNVDTGTTQLVSTGPAGGNGPFDVSFYRVHVSADGTRVFFNTKEQLVSSDTNGQYDAYMRDLTTGMTQIVSTGPGGPAGGVMDGISQDGSKAFFDTNAAITNDDTDHCTQGRGCSDIYERDLNTGTTTLISTGPLGGQSGYEAQFAGATPDGSHVYFHTAEPLVAQDTDTPGACPPLPNDGYFYNGCVDVYERSGGRTTLISTSPTKNPGDPAAAQFAGATPDGAHVYFMTLERLVPADTDSVRDVYVHENGQTVLISDTQGKDTTRQGAYLVGWTAQTGAVGPVDPGRLFLDTAEQWLPSDTDTTADVYAKSGGTLSIATDGPIGGSGSYFTPILPWASDTGRLFFTTSERLALDDPDDAGQDIYQWHDGTTTVISKGTTGQSSGASFTTPEGIADHGKRYFFTALGKLVPEDRNNNTDVYVSIVEEAPRCDGVRPDRAFLWPANHKFRTVTLSGATDPDGDPVTVSITGVTQDEPLGRQPDAQATSGEAVRLRAERDPRGDGRVYRIAFEATDDHGQACAGQVTVSVPRRRKQRAVDSAPPSYDSFVPAG